MLRSSSAWRRRIGAPKAPQGVFSERLPQCGHPGSRIKAGAHPEWFPFVSRWISFAVHRCTGVYYAGGCRFNASPENCEDGACGRTTSSPSGAKSSGSVKVPAYARIMSGPSSRHSGDGTAPGIPPPERRSTRSANSRRVCFPVMPYFAFAAGLLDLGDLERGETKNIHQMHTGFQWHGVTSSSLS